MKIQIRLYFFLYIFLINIALLKSQSLHIVDVEDCNYPTIAVTFELGKPGVCDFSKLKVVEKDNVCNFHPDYYFEQQQKRLIAFIVDESLFYNSQSHSFIYKLIKTALCNVKYPKLVNTLIISNSNSELRYKPISIEFTDSCMSMVEKYDSIIVSQLPYKKGIDRMFNYINKYNVRNVNLVLIKSKSLSGNTFNELQKYSDSLSIKCENIVLKPQLYKQAESTKILTKQIGSAISENSFIELGASERQYKIYFKTRQKGKLNFFELHYIDGVTKGFYKHNNSNRISQNQIPFDYISLVLFVIIIVLLYFLIYKKQRKKEQNQSDYANINHTLNITDTNYGSIKPYLSVVIDDETEKFELKKLRTTIGRGNDNDILIPNLTISNHHATITNEGGVFYIEDNDSTNGVLVNDIKISKHEIKTTDIIRVGKASLHLTF